MGAASDNDNHARSIGTIVPHELESVEDNGDQMARKHQRHQRNEEEEE